MARMSIGKLMVTIGVAAVVLAIIAQIDWHAGREIGQFPNCQRNLRLIFLALYAFQIDNNRFPGGNFPNSNLEPQDRLSWLADILPYLEDQELYDQIDRTQAWNQGPNKAVASTNLTVVHCTLAPRSPNNGIISTNFIGIAGLGLDAPVLAKNDPRAGIFGYDRQTTLADIKDGASYTMMVAETGRGMGSWMQGGIATVRGLDPANQPYIGPGRQFGHSHLSGTNVAMADGSVRWFSGSVDPKIFEALSTIAGGEKVLAKWQE
jgi:prepilin-type processing-associated H-X9-DG protein